MKPIKPKLIGTSTILRSTYRFHSDAMGHAAMKEFVLHGEGEHQKMANLDIGKRWIHVTLEKVLKAS